MKAREIKNIKEHIRNINEHTKNKREKAIDNQPKNKKFIRFSGDL